MLLHHPRLNHRAVHAAHHLHLLGTNSWVQMPTPLLWRGEGRLTILQRASTRIFSPGQSALVVAAYERRAVSVRRLNESGEQRVTSAPLKSLLGRNPGAGRRSTPRSRLSCSRPRSGRQERAGDGRSKRPPSWAQGKNNTDRVHFERHRHRGHARHCHRQRWKSDPLHDHERATHTRIHLPPALGRPAHRRQFFGQRRRGILPLLRQRQGRRMP